MSAANGQAASSELPSLADMFKPKPGEWDCPTCKTRNKPTATIKCMACEEAKPGAPAQAAVGGSAGGATFSFGTKAAAAASSSVVAPSFQFGTKAPAATGTTTSNGFTFGTTAPAGGSGLSSGGFGASSAAPPSAPAVSGSFAFVVQDEGLDEKESDSDIVIRLQESKLDVQDEAAAAQADAIFDRKSDAIVARVAAKLRAELSCVMPQLLSLSQGVAVA